MSDSPFETLTSITPLATASRDILDPAGWKNLKAITPDATVSFQWQDDVEVTDHQVEQGADVSDHARKKPATFTAEMIISDSPLSAAQALRAGVEDGSTAEIGGHPQEVYAQLLDAMGQARMCTVVTSLRKIDAMLITSLSTPRDASTGKALRFTISMKELRIVQNKTQIVEVRTAHPGGKPEKKLGKVTAAEAKVLQARAKLITNAQSMSDIIEGLSGKRPKPGQTVRESGMWKAWVGR